MGPNLMPFSEFTAARPPNRLLAELSPEDQRGLSEKIEMVSLAQGQILHDHNETPRFVYFPMTAVISLRNVMDSGASIEVVVDPAEAVVGARVLYTDVWTSMGQEAEHDRRLRDLAPFRLDEDKLALAASDSVAMHCLPAHVGEEITDGVLYGDRSAVWDQAENRLHAYKAVLALTVR